MFLAKNTNKILKENCKPKKSTKNKNRGFSHQNNVLSQSLKFLTIPNFSLQAGVQEYPPLHVTAVLCYSI